MTDKDFDKRIGDALRGYEEEPPRELFQRIEETLAAAGAAPRKRQRIRHAYGYAVAAALLAGVLVTALYLSRPAGITEEAAVRQTAVVLPDGTGDTAVPDTDAGSEPPQTVSGANTPQPVRAVAKTDGEDTVPERQTAGAAPPTDIVYNGFGEITRTDYDGYFEITRDDGVLLRVLEYNGSKEIERGERVYFKYNILPGNGDYVSSYSTPEQTVYDIRVLVFNDIHAVPIVRKSFLLEDDPHRSDSIGHDLIRVVTAAFSGNYINIGFEYFRYENGQPHMINLVWDDTRPATDSVYLELRHNAMGEVEGNGRYVVSDTGLASFRIADLVPEGEESIDIKLKSNMDRKDGVGEYIETEKYHTGTYTTGSTAKTYIVGGELYPPENHTAFVRN